VRRLLGLLLVLCFPLLAAHAGTITVENLDADTVTVLVRQNGTTKTSGDVAAFSTYTFNAGVIDTGVAIEIRYTYQGVTRTAGTWAEGSSDAKIPSSRFRIRVINNTASAVNPLIRRNGSTVNDWGTLAAYSTTETSVNGWSDFWFGGPGTYTVRNGINSTDANPTGGLATGDYVQGFGVAPGVMIFTFGSATYQVTRCIRNNHTGFVNMYWERDGVTVRTEYAVPPGVTVCHTYNETAGTSHNYREQVQVMVTQVNPDGSHSLVSNIETTGELNNNGGQSTGTGDYAGPDLPSNGTRSPIAQTNFTGGNGVVGFTNQNLSGGSSEGTLQAGFNAVIAADNANTDRVVSAVTAAGEGIEGALGNLSFTNPVTVNITNNITLTNLGDGTNLITRWDAWSNAGAAVGALASSATNYATKEADVESSGVRGVLENFGFPSGLPAPSLPGTGGAADWQVTVGSYTFNLDPVTHPLFGPLLAFLRNIVLYVMLGLYAVIVFRRLDECSQDIHGATQLRVPHVTVMGNTVGWASSPVLITVVSTLIVGVPTALLAIWQADPSVSTFAGGIASVFASASGPAAMAVRLADSVIPLDSLVTLVGSWFVVMMQSRVIVFIASFVMRLLPS